MIPTPTDANADIIDETLGLAAKVDDLEEEAVEETALEGPAEGIAAVVDALNQVMPLFGPDSPVVPSEEGATVLPAEGVKALEMIDKAAQDYGNDALPSITDPTDDVQFTTLAGALIALAQDKTFANFLRTLPPGPEEEAPADVPASGPTGAPDLEDLFASRI